MLDVRRIDQIRDSIESGVGHMGAETEGIVTHPIDLTVVHSINGQQPAQAVKAWIAARPGPAAAEAASRITPDVPETTVEANPPPMHSPRSTAASQRLLAILADAALQAMHPADAPRPQLLHGAAWRPPGITVADVSQVAEPFKRLYYEFQIGLHGDKVGAAAGDHLNLSAPWLGHPGAGEISRKMVEMTARMRLIGGALSVGLSASSPLYFGAERSSGEARYRTALTPWESARLGHVWPGRTIMDVSDMFRDPVSFRRTMARFADNGTLLSGRDVWLMARAQPGPHEAGPPFSELCTSLGIDLDTPRGFDHARELLHAAFHHGPQDAGNSLRLDPAWRQVEDWRQGLLQGVIRAPRNRMELRTLETPPAFGPDSPGGEWQTPYEYIKALHSFFELLFIYLSETPAMVEDLEYGEVELQAAKSNEQAALLAGMDARLRWLPSNMHGVPARDALQTLLDAIRPLAEGLDRAEDLRLIEQVASGEALAPAARLRAELGQWYGIDAQLRHNMRILPHDSYPRMLLRRSRTAMAQELEQIEADLPSVPAADHAYLSALLELVKDARRQIVTDSLLPHQDTP